jgi:hypothetical protein
VPRARLERATSGFVDRRSDPTELTRRETGAREARRFNAALSMPSYPLVWRLVRESNPRLPARQAGTLATELTRRGPHWFHPVTGSGAAQSCGRFPPSKR